MNFNPTAAAGKHLNVSPALALCAGAAQRWKELSGWPFDSSLFLQSAPTGGLLTVLNRTSLIHANARSDPPRVRAYSSSRLG